MKCDVIIAGAGSGSRMKSNENKVWMLLHGKPIIMYSIQTFLQNEHIGNIYVTIQLSEYAFFEKMMEKYQIDQSRVFGVIGGKTRQESVFAALKKVVSYEVLIHDGARPFIQNEEIHALIHALQFDKGVILGRKPVDTIKEINAVGEINRTLNRELLIGAQTPQGFDTQLLVEANELALEESFEGTDDASIFSYKHFDAYVKVIEGSALNIKITHPQDLIFADAILTHFTEGGKQ